MAGGAHRCSGSACGASRTALASRISCCASGADDASDDDDDDDDDDDAEALAESE